MAWFESIVKFLASMQTNAVLRVKFADLTSQNVSLSSQNLSLSERLRQSEAQVAVLQQQIQDFQNKEHPLEERIAAALQKGKH